MRAQGAIGTLKEKNKAASGALRMLKGGKGAARVRSEAGGVRPRKKSEAAPSLRTLTTACEKGKKRVGGGG